MPRRCGNHHHLIWRRSASGGIAHACAHCRFVAASHLESGDLTFIRRQCEASEKAHRQDCGGRWIGSSFSDGEYWRSSAALPAFPIRT